VGAATEVLATGDWISRTDKAIPLSQRDDGVWVGTTRPGLGVTLDEAVAAKRPYQPHTRQQLRFPDGGIADH